ncbi:hypothetical protein KHC17_01365 [Agrobacterium salinitolerans]|uniref:hypothetical protein n=1 Tax=Agrobacterium salinitolerans TaxID=1183413 RepID=UPI001C233EBF|nr:hypothetical protein [Agrobacterium salinitolerans]QXC48806.1 hypothetical protein KHC17_01365 [Agrobacterium salinitolerans]
MADFAVTGGQFELPATVIYIGFCMKDELFSREESDYEGTKKAMKLASINHNNNIMILLL